MRDLVAPITACKTCKHPVCCHGYDVRALPSEAALIIREHPDVIESLKDEIVADARKFPEKNPCPLQDEQGWCRVHSVAPWMCVYYVVSKLESWEDCQRKLENPERPEGFLQYGPFAFPAHIDRTRSFELDRSKLVGIKKIQHQPLSNMLVQVMALQDRSWLEAWKDK